MKLITAFCLLLITSYVSAQTTWTPVNHGLTNNDLTKIYFKDDNNGFVLGKNGTLLKTTDGGNSWTSVSTGVNHDLLTISFSDANTGYINGLRTTNGGSTWTLQNSTQNYMLLQCFGSNLIVGGSKSSFFGGIYKSTNNGNTWNFLSRPITTGFYTSSSLINSSVGYMTSWYSGNLVKTTDGGNSWQRITSIAPLIDDLQGVHFPSLNTGIVVGGPATIVKTTDQSLSWSSIFPTNGPSTANCRGVYAISDNHYIVVGKLLGTNGFIYETTNGGTTWSTSLTSSHLSNIKCTSNNCFAIGKNGTILKKAISSSNKYTSVSKVETSPIQIYPNPVLNTLNIDSQNTGTSAKLYNSIGKHIKTINLTNHRQLNMTNLPSGIYFLETELNGQLTKHKIVKL